MTTWALIACSKTKADHPCTAREMYWPSALFRGAWRVAESRGESPLILSAKYGLVLPDDAIRPYDATLVGKDAAFRERWALNVWRALGSYHMCPPGTVIVSYLSAPYAEFLVKWLRSHGITVDEPLKGLGQGKRLQWFKQNGGAA